MAMAGDLPRSHEGRYGSAFGSAFGSAIGPADLWAPKTGREVTVR